MITFRGDASSARCRSTSSATVDVETLSDRINIYNGATLVASLPTGSALGVAK